MATKAESHAPVHLLARAHTHTQTHITHMIQSRPPHFATEKSEQCMTHSLGHHLPPDCKTTWLRLQCIRDLVKHLISV